jgi:hypothetical protein
VSYVILGTRTTGSVTEHVYSFRCDHAGGCMRTRSIQDVSVLEALRKLEQGNWTVVRDGTREGGGLILCPRHPPVPGGCPDL